MKLLTIIILSTLILVSILFYADFIVRLAEEELEMIKVL